MVDKSKLKDDLKSMVGDLKTAANQTNEKANELVDIYERHSFEHALIDYNEPVDEWNMRDILPAFPTKKCCIPIPPDSGFFDRREPHYMDLFGEQKIKK